MEIQRNKGPIPEKLRWTEGKHARKVDLTSDELLNIWQGKEEPAEAAKSEEECLISTRIDDLINLKV